MSSGINIVHCHALQTSDQKHDPDGYARLKTGSEWHGQGGDTGERVIDRVTRHKKRPKEQGNRWNEYTRFQKYHADIIDTTVASRVEKTAETTARCVSPDTLPVPDAPQPGLKRLYYLSGQCPAPAVCRLTEQTAAARTI